MFRLFFYFTTTTATTNISVSLLSSWHSRCQG